MKTAVLFQGIGPLYDGLYHQLEAVEKKRIHDMDALIREQYDFSLVKKLSGEKQDFPDMLQNIFCIYAADLVAFEQLSRNIRPDYGLCYSLGLITGAAASRSIDFTTGLHLAAAVYNYLSKSAQPQAMAFVVGLEQTTIAHHISRRKLTDQVFIAAVNKPDCLVISGERTAVGRIMDDAAASGALLVKPIRSDFACHTPLAKHNDTNYQALVAAIDIRQPDWPLFSTYRLAEMNRPEQIRTELAVNLYSMIRWGEAIHRLNQLGVGRFIGAGYDEGMIGFSKCHDITATFKNYKKRRKAA